MFKKFPLLAAICGVVIWTLPARAETVTYICTFHHKSHLDPVPDQVTLTIDAARMTASVQDDYTRQLRPGPLRAKIETLSSKRLRVSWQVLGVSHTSRDEDVKDGMIACSLRLRRDTLTASLTGVMREFGADLHGKARCAETS